MILVKDLPSASKKFSLRDPEHVRPGSLRKTPINVVVNIKLDRYISTLIFKKYFLNIMCSSINTFRSGEHHVTFNVASLINNSSFVASDDMQIWNLSYKACFLFASLPRASYVQPGSGTPGICIHLALPVPGFPPSKPPGRF